MEMLVLTLVSNLETSKSLEEVEARHVKQLGCPGVRLTTIREGGREVEILDGE